MSEESTWVQIQKKVIDINDFRTEYQEGLLSCLMSMAQEIVDDFKTVREWHRFSDSSFRYWTYAPSIEKGTCSVIIRWRKYSGKGKFSNPVPTSGLKDFRLPMSNFPGCTRDERLVIKDVEDRFSEIRRINEKLLIISRAHNALLDITGARGQVLNSVSDSSVGYDSVTERSKELDLKKGSSKPFTEEDRIAFRKSIGLDR